MSKDYKVIQKKVGEECEIVVMKDGLQPIQDFVGGYMEVLTFHINNIKHVIVMNEEGKISNLEPNVALMKQGQLLDILHGNIFIASVNDEDFSDVDENSIEELSVMLNNNKLIF